MPKITPTYLDYAAATPLSQSVKRAISPYQDKKFFNPSSLYTEARHVREQLESARRHVATTLGAKSQEIIFTAGATESINLAINGAKQVTKAKKIIISAIEHEAVIAAARAFYGKQNVIQCPVDRSGQLNLEAFERFLGNDVGLVSIMYANNEIGTVQPLAKIASLIRKHPAGKNIIFHTDAAQAANYLPLNINRLGVDLLTLNGSKTYGPKQSGCLYIRRGLKLAPFIHGGGQEQGLRSGTENVAGCIGFSAALVEAQELRQKETKRLEILQKRLVDLLQKDIDNIKINGGLRNRLPNNLNISIPGQSGERLVHLLDAKGFQVATGSACSANNDQPSHVLRAIGLSVVLANSSLRITLGRQTTETDIARLAKALTDVLSA